MSRNMLEDFPVRWLLICGSFGFLLHQTFCEVSQISLHCVKDFMIVNITTDEEFDGVIYAKGNFMDDKCKDDVTEPDTAFSFKLPLDGCKTEKVGEGQYSNVVVVQHHDMIVTGTDAAFTLVCDYSPRLDLITVENVAQFAAVNGGDTNYVYRDDGSVTDRVRSAIQETSPTDDPPISSEAARSADLLVVFNLTASAQRRLDRKKLYLPLE